MSLLSGGVIPAENEPIQVGGNALEEGGPKNGTLPAEVAVRLAWTDDGCPPRLLATCQDGVREIMPDLARALDRLSQT